LREVLRRPSQRPSAQVGLDFYHVAGGALWTAIDLFLGLLLGPIMGALSVPARIELSSRLMPKMALLMPARSGACRR
jgi:hypothetical protein